MQIVEMPCGCTLNTQAHEFNTAQCPIHSRPYVQDQPCPKCGSDQVRMQYQDGGSVFDSGRHHDCRGVVPTIDRSTNLYVEHFHRTCQRCSHQWPTVDVLSAS